MRVNSPAGRNGRACGSSGRAACFACSASTLMASPGMELPKNFVNSLPACGLGAGDSKGGGGGGACDLARGVAAGSPNMRPNWSVPSCGSSAGCGAAGAGLGGSADVPPPNRLVNSPPGPAGRGGATGGSGAGAEAGVEAGAGRAPTGLSDPNSRVNSPTSRLDGGSSTGAGTGGGGGGAAAG
jgi:hypothetical protein